MHKLKRILAYLARSYRPDPRALSLMRIGLALVIMADLLIRGGDLTAHYTDEGIWPTHLIRTFNGKPWAWSLHAISGSYAWALTLFIIHFMFAGFLLFGFKTRLATFALWLLTISLHNRNIYILQSGDDLLRLLLFWGLFLPWQAHYAIDARTARPPANRLAGFGYLLLIASVYFFTANLKSSPEWHGEGSAVYYALSLDQMRLAPFGDLLYQQPGLMRALTWLVFHTELILPFLVLLPGGKGWFRLLAFVAIILLHSGIGLTLYVGLFFVINIVSALGLLPGFMMDWLEHKLKLVGTKSRSVLQPAWLKAMVNTICALAISLGLVINLGRFSWFAYELRGELVAVADALRLDQYWGMFSPGISKTDGWFVYYGIDSVGRQHDLRLNSDYVDFKKPEHVVKMYRTDRWRKLAELMQAGQYTFLRPRYCRYVLHRWNEEHPGKKLATLNLYFMEKENLPGYRSTPVTKNLYCICDDL